MTAACGNSNYSAEVAGRRKVDVMLLLYLHAPRHQLPYRLSSTQVVFPILLFPCLIVPQTQRDWYARLARSTQATALNYPLVL